LVFGIRSSSIRSQSNCPNEEKVLARRRLDGERRYPGSRLGHSSLGKNEPSFSPIELGWVVAHSRLLHIAV